MTNRAGCWDAQRCAPARERGQATVELALVLPVLFLFVWTGVESLALLHDQVLVTNAAREAARSAAVGAAPGEAAAIGRQRSGLGVDALMSVRGGGAIGDDATAVVQLSERGRLPVLGRIVPYLQVRAAVTMRGEGPPEGPRGGPREVPP